MHEHTLKEKKQKQSELVMQANTFASFFFQKQRYELNIIVLFI